MTDGGGKDCTSVIQLLLRRRERILLVLAAGDPLDECEVLLKTLDLAKKLELACFYDPSDPRSDVTVLIKKYREDKEMCTLHLGYSYCYDDPDRKPTHGNLYVVKNRLPPSMNRRIQPPIRPEEIMEQLSSEDEEAEFSDWDPAEWGDLREDELGANGCCDCCQRRNICTCG